MDGSWLAGSGLGKLAMLSRRTFLTTIAAAPLARFCKTELVRPYSHWEPRVAMSAKRLKELSRSWRGYNSASAMDELDRLRLECRFERRVEPKAVVERLYNLPQGTLG
jgi:hypothetical protein